MPAITTTPQYLLASNLSSVFIKTQATLGAFDDPTSGAGYGNNAVRVVGTPKFSVRGAGIIQRADVMTPWGGNQSSKTGGLGWDITLTTELFWQLGQNYDATLSTLTQLHALFLASPWAITNPTGDNVGLSVQPLFYAEEDRNTVNFAVQPFSIVYEETGGKRFEAYDCVAVPKLSWEYGQKISIEWTIKGKWLPVTDATGVTPTYRGAATEPPLVGVNCNLSLSGYFDNVNAVSKVTIDTGWAINDVADFRETYGFGLGFINLAASPSIEVDVADIAEGNESDWGSAQANTIFGGPLTLGLTVGSYAITFTLSNPQPANFPTPGELNSYRTNTVKFQGIPDSSTPVMTWEFEGA
jgi:hypothetical protein